METLIDKYKGIHPGMILERELSKRGLKKRPFALNLHVFPQLLNEITKGRRGVTPELAIRIDDALGLEEGTMFLLQAFYEINNAKIKMQPKPDLKVLRKALFWDTDVDKIDWKVQSNWVVLRVFERGNKEEKEEITRFYGQDKISEVMGGNIQPQVMGHLRSK